MEEEILRFAEQFSWEPEVIRSDRLPADRTHFIVCGMGGSHLGANLLLRHDPTLNLTIHSDYGLPPGSSRHLSTALIIASSYSGETEETLDAAQKALGAGIAVAVVTTGGALARFAEEHDLPLVLIPMKNLEPRMAIGASMLALARLMSNAEMEQSLRTIGASLSVREGRSEDVALAKRLAGFVPLVYSSTMNAPLAYFWKIEFNETSKVPAFYNLFPELCHNELNGFNNEGDARALSSKMHVLMLRDSDDDPRTIKRMNLMQELLEERGTAITNVELTGANALEKVLNGVVAGIWTALALAKEYGVPAEPTPLIEEFKRKMREP